MIYCSTMKNFLTKLSLATKLTLKLKCQIFSEQEILTNETALL